MNNMKTLFSLVFLSSLVYLSNSQCFTLSDNSPMPNPMGRLGLYTGQQEFSLELLNAINQLAPTENIFVSPYSTYHALLITYFISGGNTEAYLKKTLRLDPTQTKSDIYQAYKLDKLATSVRAVNSSYKFTSANKIYVNKNLSVRDCILGALESEFEITNFTQPEIARNKINLWVEEQTHKMIKDLLPSGSIDTNTDLVLVNAAYFKGVWVKKFDPQLTKPEIFYVSPSKQIMVDMMHIESTFNYAVSENLGAHILEMPYQGDHISMYILLPPFAKPGAMEETLKKLSLQEFKKVVDGTEFISTTVSVALPKFTLEHTVELVPILQKLGVGDLFTDARNLTGLSEQSVNLGSALHKARIEVHEEGTEAAAATVLFSFRSSRPLESAVFQCNHPFVYVIYDKLEQAVLFMGVFRRPN